MIDIIAPGFVNAIGNTLVKLHGVCELTECGIFGKLIMNPEDLSKIALPKPLMRMLRPEVCSARAE